MKPRAETQRGFACLDVETRRAISRKGAAVLHALGRAHRWTATEAAAAGRKGGKASRGGKGKAS